MTKIRIWEAGKRYMGKRATERFRITYDSPTQGKKHLAIRDFKGILTCCDDKRESPGFYFKFAKSLVSV